MPDFDRLADAAQAASRKIGDAASWLMLAVAAAGMAMLLLRHVLAFGDVAMPPAYVWCTSLVMMAGSGVALKSQADDMPFLAYLSLRAKGWVMTLGALVVLFPWAVLLDVFAGSLSLLFPALVGETSGTLDSVWWRGCVDVGAFALALEGLGLLAHGVAALSLAARKA